MPESESPGRNW